MSVIWEKGVVNINYLVSNSICPVEKIYSSLPRRREGMDPDEGGW